ncbi:MAG: response regulator transcription factor [Acidimicrobiia bacterium]|nr:response regulator transcription factor [Acidimicrobiia bacterium]
MVGRSRAGAPTLVGTREPDGRLTVRTHGTSGRMQLRELDRLPESPWRLDQHEVRGIVSEPADVTAAVLAVARGAAIDVQVPPERPDTATDLLEALERLGGTIEVVEPVVEGPTALDTDSRRLLDLLADGATLTEAATALGYSRRTVQRRLEGLRRQLGVRTNREAIVASRSVP